MNSALQKNVAAFDNFVRCLKTWNCATLSRQFISFICSEESQGTPSRGFSVDTEVRAWLICLHAIPQYTKAMSAFTAELIGTMLLILLGDGVVANVLLNK